jgi:formylmethanofuran dehydrogenase subunit B
MKKAIDKPETCRDDEWIVRELKERVMKLREEPNTAPKYVPNPNAL